MNIFLLLYIYAVKSHGCEPHLSFGYLNIARQAQTARHDKADTERKTATLTDITRTNNYERHINSLEEKQKEREEYECERKRERLRKIEEDREKKEVRMRERE